MDDDEVKNFFSDENDDTENEEDANEKTVTENDVAKMFSDNENSETSEENGEVNNNGTDNDDEEDEEKETTKTQNNGTNEPQKESTVDFSSITKQFVDDGIFEKLDDDELAEINDTDSFKKLIQKAIDNGIDEETKRVKEALELGINGKDVADYENTIKYLHGITKEDLLDDSDEGNTLRQKLILQNFINDGIDEKEAVEKVKAIFKKGKDIDEAEKALEANRKYFRQAYKDLMDDARKKADEQESLIKKQTEDLKSSIMDVDKYLGEIDIDEKTKKLALKNLSEPIFKDKESGQMLTAIQKYERENKTDFLKNLGLLFTITDGFKNIDKLVNKAVKRRVNKEIENVEDMLRHPSSSDETLKLVRGSNRSNVMETFKFDI